MNQRAVSIIVGILLGAVLVLAGKGLESVLAQGGGINFGPIVSSVSACPVPLTGQVSLCGVGTTVYVSFNAGAYQPLVGAPSKGVTSWNSQTGAVTYSPASVSCANAVIAKKVLNASGCTIN